MGKNNDLSSACKSLKKINYGHETKKEKLSYPLFILKAEITFFKSVTYHLFVNAKKNKMLRKLQINIT